MIKQLKMINDENKLVLLDVSDENKIFIIDMESMIFDSQNFYDTFFKDINEKIEFNIENLINESSSIDYKKCMKIYDLVKSLFNDIQLSLNEFYCNEKDNNNY